ncbi:hypothetical protein C8R45DRAFT_1223828 [Mycena sanguinolenta]|nr:hypothetical protein C8R45DRAFT_1223828 [Mycena sanguinolenta]
MRSIKSKAETTSKMAEKKRSGLKEERRTARAAPRSFCTPGPTLHATPPRPSTSDVSSGCIFAAFHTRFDDVAHPALRRWQEDMNLGWRCHPRHPAADREDASRQYRIEDGPTLLEERHRPCHAHILPLSLPHLLFSLHLWPGDKDDKYANANHNGVRGARRARPDELEGLLADSASGEDGWGHNDAAADPDALSLHSHLGPRGRRRPPPRTLRHISLWGFHLFWGGRGRGETRRYTGARRLGTGGAPRHRRPPGATPTQLKDVTLADVPCRAGSNATSHLSTSGAREGEVDSERRARRKSRKSMRRLAAALAEAPHTPDSAAFEGFPSTTSHTSSSPRPLTRAGYPPRSSSLHPHPHPRTPSRISKQAKMKKPRTSTASRASAKPKKPKKSKRSTKSHSSATSFTLASPPPTSTSFPSHSFAPSPLGEAGVRDSAINVDFGPFSPLNGGGGEDDFDGTPGRFGASDFYADADAGGEERVVREALPSPGLSRRGSAGFGKGMGGF